MQDCTSGPTEKFVATSTEKEREIEREPFNEYLIVQLYILSAGLATPDGDDYSDKRCL